MLANANQNPQYISISVRVNLIHLFIMSAFLFALPINSSAKSITLVFAVSWIFIRQINYVSFKMLINQAWVITLIAFLLLVILECFRSPASFEEQFFVIQKYSKLLWLPVLALGFADRITRFWGLHAFLVAMFVTCIVAFIFAAHWFGLQNTGADGTVFRNYIITGHMMCLACYLAAYFAIKDRKHRILYIGLFFLFSYEVLFFSIGRTGYVIYFVLMLLLMLQTLNKQQLLLGAFGALGMILIVFHFSPRMQAGFENIRENVQTYKHGDQNTSVGYRLQFQRFAFQLFKESPLIGHGTGSFTYYFDKRNPIPTWGHQLREPHNQYWLIAAEYGILGIVTYFLLLASLIITAWNLYEMKNIAMAVIIPFLIGGFSDSLLFFSGSGYFFLAFMAVCLGESLGEKRMT